MSHRRRAGTRTSENTSEIDTIRLSHGDAPAEAFPATSLAEIARDVVSTRAHEALQYGQPQGYGPLRKLVAAWLQSDGIRGRPQDVQIVTGAKQGIELALRAVTTPGDSVIVGAPTYMNALRIIRANRLRPLTVPHDSQGLDVHALERLLQSLAAGGATLPRLIYDIPDFHNPTGAVLEESRREKLVAVASAFQIPVIEDMTYRWTRPPGPASKSLCELDTRGNTIGIGTFSKVLGPGLRIGWIHGNRKLLASAVQYKSDGGTSPLTQMIAHEFFRADGSLDRHRATIRTILTAKREGMLSALQEMLGRSASWTSPVGGYYVWASIPSVDTDALEALARVSGVEFFSGSMFFASDPAPRHYLRLAFSYESPERIRRGIQTIGASVASLSAKRELARR